MTLEGLHAFNAGELGRGENAVGQHHIARPHAIAPVGADRPLAGGFIPVGAFNRGVKQAAVVKAKALGHGLAVLQNFKTRGKFHGRNDAHFLQQRQVAVGLHVASNARVAVPVPGAADIAALLAKTHVLKACGAQLVPEQQRAKACTNHQNLAGVGQRFTLNGRRGIDVFKVAGKLAFHGHVVSRAAAGFLELPVSRLFLGIEHRTGRRWRQYLERCVRERRIALASDLVRGLGGTGIEGLQPGGFINANGRRHGGSAPWMAPCSPNLIRASWRGGDFGKSDPSLKAHGTWSTRSTISCLVNIGPSMPAIPRHATISPVFGIKEIPQR